MLLLSLWQRKFPETSLHDSLILTYSNKRNIKSKHTLVVKELLSMRQDVSTLKKSSHQDLAASQSGHSFVPAVPVDAPSFVGSREVIAHVGACVARGEAEARDEAKET